MEEIINEIALISSDPVGAGVTSTKIVQLDRATNRTLVVLVVIYW